ncbi:MAG TPA: DUF3160 domain-containing protein [Polyangiaceae bacterium]|nr:DUF3160 domain-containing protein [Polyangiaceae bacterium]
MLRNAVTTGWLIAAVFACSSEPGGPNPSAIPSVPSKLDPGVTVAVAAPAAAIALNDDVDAARQLSPDELRTAHAVEFASELGYDPLKAANLDAIFKGLGFSSADATRAQLAKAGFALENEGRYPSFVSGYSDIYAADLPVFVSTDMVLEAIYRSHDKILQTLEQQKLQPRLEHLLTSLRAALIERASSLEPEVASDLNFYLGVALSLLHGGEVDAREPEGVKDFVSLAMKAEGTRERVLFGVKRELDFSQFKPRGHYAGDKKLESYFRAMIWLGRTDFRLIETTPDGEQVLRRRQVESVVALRKLLSSEDFAEYQAIDATIGAFVGEHDYMTLEEVDELLVVLKADDDLASVNDEALAEAIVSGQFGEQRIASQVMRRLPGGPATLPLSASFALFGQRYTVDSHVFSNVVYDRVPTRVLPDPLDAAFAAIGNDQALSLLGSELDDEAGYAGQLSAMRTLVDAHPSSYWQSSLYTNWLGALRTLSPAATPAADLPAVARSEAWGRRLLNTQLSSWAQLRHNNVLYVKQSYTSGATCEYPEAYVDPYPDFFEAVVTFAERAQELTSGLGLDGKLGERVQAYFANVARINAILAEMARAQRSGAPHSAEHMAFINQAVKADVGCDGSVFGHSGWYSELHFEPLQAVEADPAITDVHTDVGGDLPVARPPTVLHVGTGLPRLMVMTVDSCNGPRAYAGVVSSYHELLADGFTRLTDEEWKQKIYGGNLPVVPWLEPLLVKATP